MRVAHVITRLIVGGAQENTLFTVAGLRRRGHDVVLITGPTQGPEGSLVGDALASGIPILEVPHLVREINPGKDLAAYRCLWRLFREGSYDIVHTHSAKAGILGRITARRAAPGAVVVHTVHGPSFYPHQPPVARWLGVAAERLAASYTDHFIFVGQVMRDRYLAAGIGSAQNASVIYSGFDLAPYPAAAAARCEMRRKLGFSDGDVVIGMIGRLFPLKGQEYLLDAFSRVWQRYPQARLLLVGDGILRPALEREARRRGLAATVVFAGLVPPAEIPSYAAAMDILAHTSLREGLPKAVAQGYAAGLPVVAFDADGARELVRNGETGYLVAPRDVSALAERLADLVVDAPRRRLMGCRGRQLVESKFAVETMVDEIESLYITLQRLHSRRGRCRVNVQGDEP